MARVMSLDSDSLTMVAASSPKRGTSQRAVGTAGCISPRVAATDTPLSKSVSRSFGCDRDMSSYGPTHDRFLRRMYLRGFLRDNGFAVGNIHRARAGGCWFRRESLCPIHVAAINCDYEAMKILLEEGADPEKETSRGRTALDCALAAARDSSRPVVRLLQARLKGKICIEAPINE